MAAKPKKIGYSNKEIYKSGTIYGTVSPEDLE